MNILICYWGRKGGGSEYTKEVASHLSFISKNKVYTSFSKQNVNFDEMKDIGIGNIHINTFSNILELLINSLFFPVKALQICFFIKKHKIDVILTTMGHIWTPLFSLMIFMLKVKHVYVIHDAVLHHGEKKIFKLVEFAEKIACKTTSNYIFLSQYVADTFLTVNSIDKSQKKDYSLDTWIIQV